jgi:ribonuclease HI
MLSRVYIHADESCLGLQFKDRDSPGGAGGLIEYWAGEWLRRDYWISEPATTNNRMAIRSATEGLQALKRPCHVEFTSDSQYLVRGMSEWVFGWIRNDWRRKDGDIPNAELWQDLIEAARPHTIDWKWVRGHAGHPQNEYANILATTAAKTQTESDGLVVSGFEAWLEKERLKKRYLDFREHDAPS